MKQLLLSAFLFLLAVTSASAQTYFYVNGSTGIDSLAAGRGQSAASPWKTIGFALANVPAQTVSTSAMVYVEGNQVYSSTTNGEVFPLTPVYNVSIEGRYAVHGNKPVLQVPAGGTAFVFPSGVVFNRNQVTIESLVVRGGDYGMRMGAAPGFRHRPRVQFCVFDGQAQAPVRIDNGGAAIQDPRFFQNTFANGYKGMMLYSSGNGAITRPDVEECRFQGFANAAIEVEDRSPGGGSVGGLFRSNWFDDCGTGIRIRSAQGAVTTAATIRTSRFANIADWAVDVQLEYPYDPIVTIDECAMLDCGGGVRLTGTPLPGSYTLTMSRNVIKDCDVGAAFFVLGQGTIDVVSRDNVIDSCTTGVDFQIGSSATPPLQFTYDSQRDRVLGGVRGVRIVAGSPGSITFRSGMICGTGTAVTLTTSFQVVMHHMTIADNGTAIFALAAPGAGSAFSHLVLAGNGLDALSNGAVAFTRSCFASSTWPGVGNLNATDPQLLRPSYKLAPTSPCIDAGDPAGGLVATDYEGDPRASVGVQNGPAVPDLGADEYVYAGSARPYGTGGFARHNVFPRIAAASPNAPIGSVVQVELTGAVFPFSSVPTKFAICGFGLTEDPTPGPFDLASVGFPGSYVWNDMLGLFPIEAVSATGTATQLVPIPNNPWFVGQPLHFQWFVWMPVTVGVVSSDALRVTPGR